MIPLFHSILKYIQSIFFNQWKRKLFAVLLSVFCWVIVNQSLTTTRTFTNVPIRVMNLPPSLTIEGLQSNGKLSKKINLTLVGNKELLDPLQSSDLEVVVDAFEESGNWEVQITKKNLQSINPDLDISSGISKVIYQPFQLNLSKLVTEKMQVQITSPTGEAPRGYQFLDVWPYKLELTVTGPEDVLKKARHRDLKLTFNLSEVTKKQLDLLSQGYEEGKCDVISYLIPESWKTISIPAISESPLMINDPQAKLLRFDFIRYEYLPIETKIPIHFYFHPSLLGLYAPHDIQVIANDPICFLKGLYYIALPLYAAGIDKTFLEIVKDHIQIVVDVNAEFRKPLNWSVQIVSAQKLEDEYVEHFLAELDEEDLRLMQFNQRQEYFRNRFRSYMQRLRLINVNGTKLALNFRMDDLKIFTSVQNNAINSATTPWEDNE
jgi:YbbR-like protein